MREFILVLVFLIVSATKSIGQGYGDYRVRVDVTGNGFAHYTTIYFDDESWDPQNPPTYGWDACCDALMILGNANQPHVFTQVVQPPASPNNHRLSINGLPHVYEHTIVPLGFLPGTLAPYTFTVTELYSLPQGMTVELEDLSLNVTQDLLVDSTYDTWGAPSDDEERFAIHFYPPNVTGLEFAQKEGPISISLGQIRLNGRATEQCFVTLFDALGRELMEERFVGDLILPLDESLQDGIYMVLMWSKDGSVFEARRFIN